jgi:hypothetical protein
VQNWLAGGRQRESGVQAAIDGILAAGNAFLLELKRVVPPIPSALSAVAAFNAQVIVCGDDVTERASPTLASVGLPRASPTVFAAANRRAFSCTMSLRPALGVSGVTSERFASAAR